MSRKPLHTENTGITITDADTPGLPAMKAAADQFALASEEANTAARAIAAQIGYDGTLTVGTLEDEIRFYQRQTVQACLELGKRLLVLKELAPHGEFEKRIELLGFEKNKAQRFMRAAWTSSKSINLTLLSTQVKSMSAFMEIIMLDDDTLKNLSEMDGIDRMSTSELRAALRESSADLEQARKRSAKLAEDNADLAVRSLQKIVADTDWPDALIPLTDQIAEAGRKLAIAISDLESCRIRLFEAGSGFDETTRSAYEAAFCHVGEVYEQALVRGERLIAKERLNYDRTLGCYAADDNDVSRP